MKNLKVWQKLTLLGLILSLPFAVVTWTMVRSINQIGTDFAQRELLGVQYQRPLLTLLRDLQQHRGMASALLSGDKSYQERLEAKRADVERDLGAVDALIARLADPLGAGAAWRALQESCRGLLAEVPNMSAVDSNREHGKVVAATLALIVEVNDSSNLTLDPDIDSYYLTAASLVHVPELSEALAQAAAVGNRVVTLDVAPPGLIDQLQEFTARADYLSRQMAAAAGKAFAKTPRLRDQLGTAVEDAAQTVDGAVDQIRELTAGRVGRDEAATYFDTLANAADDLFKLDEQLLAALEDVLAVRIAGFHRQIREALLFAGLGLLAAFAIGLFIIRDITRPLREVVAIANQIAVGDLNVASALDRRNDEIGGLARSFERMIAYLREAVHVTEQIADGNLAVGVQTKSERDVIGNALAQMVAALAALVGQVQRSGIHVASSVNEIAATAKQQQATASEVAATTLQIGATSKEISATSRELVRTVGEVSTVADQSATLAGTSQSSLTRMEDTMRHVVDAAASISDKLAVLNDKAGNIGQVVTTITKIADQTNLLSLNAAIEAEKAGEYGRGFSVVATEIRRLADQTAVATYDIEQMVKEIQSAVAAGVMGMDKFSEEVRRGMHDVQQVGSQLTQIIQQVQALAPRFEEVNQGMQAQATGAEQITMALTQLNESAQQTVESLRQSSQAIEGLNQVSGGLRSSVSRFKLQVAAQ